MTNLEYLKQKAIQLHRLAYELRCAGSTMLADLFEAQASEILEAINESKRSN